MRSIPWKVFEKLSSWYLAMALTGRHQPVLRFDLESFRALTGSKTEEQIISPGISVPKARTCRFGIRESRDVPMSRMAWPHN